MIKKNTPIRLFLFNEDIGNIQIFYDDFKKVISKIDNSIEGSYIEQTIFSFKCDNTNDIEIFIGKGKDEVKLGVFEDTTWGYCNKNYYMITDFKIKKNKVVMINIKINVF